MRRSRPLHVPTGRLAAGAFGLLVAAFAFAPVAGQSPSPGGPVLGVSPVPIDATVAPGASPHSGEVAASATPPPGGVVPLPARVAAGTCETPGEAILALRGLIAGGGLDDPDQPLVFASISELSGTIGDLAKDASVVLVGGEPGALESAVACGSLDAPRQAEDVLAIALDPVNRSGYVGTALLDEARGTVSLVVVAPVARDRLGYPTAPGSPDAGSPDAG